MAHWWDRFLLSFLGPPQIGDVHAPLLDTPVVDETCPRCGRLRSEHVVVRDPGLTYVRCPS